MKPEHPDLFDWLPAREAAPSSTPVHTSGRVSPPPRTEPFEFNPGPECEPRGIATVPGHLRMWIDEPEWR